MAEIKTPPASPTLVTEAPLQSPVEQFLEKHFRAIMMGLAVLAVVLLIFGVMRYHANQTAQEAAERFTSAITVEDCDVVAQKYPGSVAAGNALVRKAELLWNDGKKESSIGTLRQFEKDYGDHPQRAAALFGLASKLAAMGEKADARTMLDGIVSKYPNSEFAAASQIQLGDLLWEEGKTDDAKKLFESIGRLYPGKMTALSAMVEQRIQLMNAGLPTTETEPPPAPKPPTPPPSAAPLAPSGANALPAPMAPPQITAPALAPSPSGAPALPPPPPPAAAKPAAEKPASPESSATIPVPTPTPAPAVPAPPPPTAATPPVSAAPPAAPAPGNLPVPPPPAVKSNP
jgi:predicted negative regulator of RcsB-dependent stress response